ncbi:pyridoxal phosphate-dependent decarboxylase family protein [Streptomyces cavernicola]|uniref:Pyridoxal-dependent decarboxylase n=1 Tax=Streptomyces cavernicola TaxID=3043613 RepID=A0ABT6S738_9ACTN|nr:pyridoxal-dependent decarboxylase [Streptomyces sp. B-S-A6]MDI3403253.1 pyridoxal-dependent decarboxylase [Streptomyces sp. B-S-A6]
MPLPTSRPTPSGGSGPDLPTATDSGTGVGAGSTGVGPSHMSPGEFRRCGHAVVDWIADYWQDLPSRPVTPPVTPGQVADRLPAQAPETGEDFGTLLQDLDTLILPGMAHWQHPGFLGFFPMTTSGPAVLAQMLTAGLNAQGMAWATNPAATELEQRVMDWLADLMALPDRFTRGGVIQDTASSAMLVALTAALWRRAGEQWRNHGSGPGYTVYTSTEANCSVHKAVRLSGLGDLQLRRIPVESHTQALRPDLLRQAVEADLSAGLTPVAAIATIGTTSTTAIDPLPAVADICRSHDVWLHVDGAYAGVAAICPELRWINDGLEHADSYSVNTHKWLLTGFECSPMWFADPAAVTQAMTVTQSYLREVTGDPRQAPDYRDWQIPLGRPFRALKLWFTLRWYGADGLRAHLRRGVELARIFADLVRGDDRFEVVAPSPFGLVCFRLRADCSVNAQLLKRLNAGGDILLSSTDVNGRFTLRMAAGGTATTADHIAHAWSRIRAEADRLTGTGHRSG